MNLKKYIIIIFYVLLFLTISIYVYKKKTCYFIKTEHKIDINNEFFNVYEYISKTNCYNKTFIILPSYSYFDATKEGYIKYEPNKDFEKLINELTKNYNRVIVVEYFGYNNSGETSRKRNSDNICEEIHKVVEYFNLKKYILLPHSISGLYSLDYLTKYKNEVEGFVGIDITLPYYFLEESDSNEKYLEHKFNDDDQKISESYKKMYNYFWETSKKLENFKFDKNLPVILFTSTMLINYIDEQIKNGSLKTKVIDYLNKMINNKNIQNIEILEGNHYLHHSKYKEMSNFINKNLQINK